jgi:hypothetical protein
VCFEKGNACSGGHSVFQNGPLPYPTLSTFFSPPLDAGYHEGKQKKKELALFNPFFLFFLNHKLSLFNVLHHQTPLIFVIFSANFKRCKGISRGNG